MVRNVTGTVNAVAVGAETRIVAQLPFVVDFEIQRKGSVFHQLPALLACSREGQFRIDERSRQSFETLGCSLF